MAATVTIKESGGNYSTVLENGSAVTLTATSQVDMADIFSQGGIVYVSAGPTATTGANYGSDTPNTNTCGIAEAIASGAQWVKLICDGVYLYSGTLAPTAANVLIDGAMSGSEKYGASLVTPTAYLSYQGSQSALTLSGSGTSGLRFRNVSFISNATNPTVRLTGKTYGNKFTDCYISNTNATGAALSIDGNNGQANNNTFEDCIAVGGAQMVPANGTVSAAVICGGLVTGESACNGNRFRRFIAGVNSAAASGAWCISSQQGDWEFEGLNFVAGGNQSPLQGMILNGTGPYVFCRGMGMSQQTDGSQGGETGPIFFKDTGGSGLVVIRESNLPGGNFQISSMNWVFRGLVPSGFKTYLNISGGQVDYDNTNDDFQSKMNVYQTGGLAIWTDKATPAIGSARFVHSGGTRWLYSGASA